MNTLRHIASVAYAFRNQSLRNLLDYHSFQLDALLHEEVILAIRRSPEPVYAPLSHYTPEELSYVIRLALREFTPISETPDQILERLVKALAVESGDLTD
jgi:hypothetical protein